jgi:hypothetical protein
MHAMGAAHHRGFFILEGLLLEDRDQFLARLLEEDQSFAHLKAEGCIENVAGSQSLMDIAGFRADMVGDALQKGGYVVFCNLFIFIDLGYFKGGLLADLLGGVFWDQVELRHRLAGGDFHLEHSLEPGFFGPKRAHFGQRIAVDQRNTPF